MKQLLNLLGILAFLLHQNAFSAHSGKRNEPDSVYLFSYGSSNPNNGLQYAWSYDKNNWMPIGGGGGFLKSDYGPWGSHKKMYSPWLIYGEDKMWHCIWSLNNTEKVYAHAASADLVNWNRQSYPAVSAGSGILNPGVKYNKTQGNYTLTYSDPQGKFYALSTRDFKQNSEAKEINAGELIASATVNLPSGETKGQINYVAWPLVDNLIKAYDLRQFKTSQTEETTLQDAFRFASLKTLDAKFTLQPEKAKKISDKLMGVFFEDINYAADGGIYAELVQNRGFEYHPHDKLNRDKNWHSKHSWSLKGDGADFSIDSVSPVHPNNPYYAVLNIKNTGAALVNAGFDGIPVKKGEKYDFSVFAKSFDSAGGKLKVRLTDKSGNVLAESIISGTSGNWKKFQTTLTSNATVADAQLEIHPLSPGKVGLDMISLFPQNTFKGRKNGLRADLAQTIADIHPRFVRFPGGCVAHGNGIHNIYHWKNTIGPLESRKPQRNLWNYHQSAGLGYFEYFQFCEDIGAEPLPVVAAGVPCQNSGDGGNGQQGGIPMDQMDEYIQDILDLIEWANGGTDTRWGKVRAQAGHPKPFNLKYIGIGNEDLITDVFEERFVMIYNAVKKAHPEVTVIGTVGPFFEGSDYREGWDLSTRLQLPMVDEHYYNRAGWFINNQDFYDRYDRTKAKVYLGEYAATMPGGGANFETALSEAIYLTAVERNGDVVSMTSYAPLLAKEGHTQWNPDMIYFNNTEVKPTAAYQVQKLYGQNAGDEYLPVSRELSNQQDAVQKRVGVSVVRDSKSKDLIVKMVNLLPVTVNTSTDLKGLKLASAKASRSLLQGKPSDKTVTPVVSEIPVSEQLKVELPPYSFTVLRIKTK